MEVRQWQRELENVAEPKSTSPFSRDYQRLQKRRAILSEAAQLFNVQGARATTLDDISARLDLNKASLYYYVKSKDDLVFQCYRASCEAFEAMVDEAESAGIVGAGKLATFVRAVFVTWKEIGEGRRDHMAILSEMRGLKPAHREQLAVRYNAILDRIRSLVCEGVTDGSLQACKPTDAALALFGLVQLTVLWLPGLATDRFAAAAESFIDIVFNGVAAQDWAPPTGMASAVGKDGPGAEGPPGDKSQAFCRAASSFFNSKGFKGTSLDEIAERIGVTKGSFYHHVSDKDDLLYQCFRRSLDIIEAVQDQSSRLGENGLDALQRAAFELFRVQTGPAGPLIRFNLIPSLEEPQRQEILDDIRRISGGFGAMLQRGIADGSVRAVDPFIAEQVLISAIDLSTELQWLRPVRDPEADCWSFFQFYFSGLNARTY
jgi:AcrR family transcriptional regulator